METLLNDKKVAYAKSNYFIYTILLEITYLLLLFVLVVIFITQNINQNKNIYCHFKTPALN